MPMFSDLNKLNTQPKTQQRSIKPTSAVVPAASPVVPIAEAPVQKSSEFPSNIKPDDKADFSPQPYQRSNVRTNARTSERTRVRHSFDIFDDQLLSLREIVLNRQILFGKKTLLGDLVQEALDLFISKERNKE